MDGTGPPGGLPPLERLPVELKTNILILSLEDNHESNNHAFIQLLRASLSYRRIYLAHQTYIHKAALLQHIHPDVLPEATVCYHICAAGYSAELPWVVLDQMERIQTDRNLSGEDWSYRQFLSMRRLHECVQWHSTAILTKALCNDNIFIFPVAQEPSSAEKRRCERMLYLAQIYFFLQKGKYMYNDQPPNTPNIGINAGLEWLFGGRNRIQKLFYTFLSGEEMDQLHCCCVGLANAIGAGYNHALRQDISLPLHQDAEYLLDAREALVGWLLTRGLDWTRNFLEADEYTRENILHNIHAFEQPPREDIDIYPVDVVKVWTGDHVPEPERQLNILKLKGRDPAYKDPDRGPRMIWELCFLNDNGADEDWREEWMWAMWDEARLRTFGALDVGTVEVSKIRHLRGFRQHYLLEVRPDAAETDLFQRANLAKEILAEQQHFGTFRWEYFELRDPPAADCENFDVVFTFHVSGTCERYEQRRAYHIRYDDNDSSDEDEGNAPDDNAAENGHDDNDDNSQNVNSQNVNSQNVNNNNQDVIDFAGNDSSEGSVSTQSYSEDSQEDE